MHAILFAMQRVVFERPPSETLRRGVIALPPVPTTIVVVAALALVVGYVIRRRLRAR